MTKAVFEPITLRNLTVRNRLWAPPMCQYSAVDADGMVQPWHVEHYGSLARGGFGAVIVEATGVVPEGRITPHCLGLWDDDQIEGMTRITERIHAHGAAAGIQLAHAGRKASVVPEWGHPGTPGTTIPVSEGGWVTKAPSAVAMPGLATPEALDEEGIDAVVEAFATAATRAVEAGFDLIQIHSAHGYLLHEFLSPLSNQRTDSYGGSLENRARLLLRVVDAIRAVVDDTFPVMVRISGTEWLPGGFDVDETAQVIAWCAEHGVDMADISSAGNHPAEIPVGPAGPGCEAEGVHPGERRRHDRRSVPGRAGGRHRAGRRGDDRARGPAQPGLRPAGGGRPACRDRLHPGSLSARLPSGDLGAPGTGPPTRQPPRRGTY